ncbi:hypothetical protein [Enterocloster asparagiformis]|nr:hypothetical protein [Enterocloster asparagiformis]
MGEWIAGLAAFGLYFLYDWNRVYRKNGWMKPFSPQAACCSPGWACG